MTDKEIEDSESEKKETGNASSAFTELVPCFVGEERAGGLGGMGLSLEKTIFLENSDKIDDGIKKIGHLVNELSKQFLSDS
jgi:hypothetical protein